MDEPLQLSGDFGCKKFVTFISSEIDVALLRMSLASKVYKSLLSDSVGPNPPSFLTTSPATHTISDPLAETLSPSPWSSITRPNSLVFLSMMV